MTDTRLDIDGLSEAIRALTAFDRETGNEAKGLLRDAAKLVQSDAQRRLGGRPGGGTYPRRRGMIGRSATVKGAGVSLKGKRYPWAFGAEFGAKRAWVYGNVTTQGRLRRRQFPVWRGNQFVVRGKSGPGWIIQPAIRKNLDKMTDNVAEGLDDLLDRVMDRHGVPS